jgi:uncharacterized membrane protein YphA (DoxX/SURF4 family)
VTPVLDPALHWVARCTLALLLLAAARHKLRDLARFRGALAGYELAPTRALPALAGCVIAAELALGAALVAGGAGPAPALAAAGLFAAYTAAIAANLARGRRAIDCGCGAHPQPLGEALLLRNLALIGLALLATLPAGGRALAALDALSVLGGSATLFALYGAVDAALANGARLRVLRT